LGNTFKKINELFLMLIIKQFGNFLACIYYSPWKHQYLFTAADNSPWNIFHSRFAIFRRHFWKLELKLRKCRY
jgi:hypothetical protein